MQPKMRGIDVSHWQGTINWKAVAQKCDFAILKAGGSDKGFYTDGVFNYNYSAASDSGLHLGCYYYVGSKCITARDGAADALRFIDMIGDKKFDMPVYLDFEAPSPRTKRGNTDAAIAFCEQMEKAGFFVGIYASDISGFKERLNVNQLTDYSLWVARYNNTPSYVKNYDMWQSTDRGRITGINGYVDLDYAYKDFPKIIRTLGFNNYKKEDLQ